MPRWTHPKRLTPPKGGVRYDLAPHEIPEECVQDGVNFFTRNGKYRLRPGYATFGAFGFGYPEGLIYLEDQNKSGIIVAACQTKWAAFKQAIGTWADITGVNAPTGNYDNPFDLLVWPQSNSLWVLGTNNKDKIKVWDIANATYTDLTLNGPNGPTAALAIHAVANRIIAANVVLGGIRYPSGILVSASNDATTWNALLVLLTDTDDAIVGIQGLNRTSVAIYKDQSQWIGTAQASDQAPFGYSLIDEQPGPVSNAAIVPVRSSQYYLANDASIYRFDGIFCENVGSAIQEYIWNNINWNYKNRSHGVYRRRDKQIWFFFVSNASPYPFLPDMGISYNILTGACERLKFGTQIISSCQGDDVGGLAWNQVLGQWVQQGQASWASLGGTDAPLEYLGDNSSGGQVQKYGNAQNDNGISIDGYFVTPAMAIAGEDNLTRVEQMDVFTNRDVVAQADVSFGTAEDSVNGDILSDKGPFFQAPITFNPSQDARHKITPLQNSPVETRYLSTKVHVNLSSGVFEFRGGLLFTNSKPIT